MSNSQLLWFLLLWSLSAIVTARTTTENPLKDSLSEAQDTFLNAQGTIIRTHAGEIISGSLNELKNRLQTLQSEIEKLIQSSNARSSESETCISAMNNLTISYSTIESRLRGLEMEFGKHNIFESRTILFRDIIADIRNQRFLLADEKFIQLEDTDALKKIVHEVYAHSVDNMKLLLNFSAAIPDSDRCFAVLNTLYEELSSNRQSKLFGLIRLAQILENQDFNCYSSDTTFKYQLVSQIEITAFNMLFESIKMGNFATNETIKAVLDALYDYSSKEFDVVTERLIDEIYGTMDSRVILSNIFKRCSTSQAVYAIGNLFWKVNKTGLYNDSDLVIDIASKLSQLRDRDDVSTLTKEVKMTFEQIVQRIPDCARNLFFEKQVCFWNKATHSYITAVEDKFNYDKERRRVLAPANQIIPQGSQWFPVKQDDDILFRNKQYPKEFLYYANFEYNKENRYLFSWIAGNNKDNQSAFKIQLLNYESCYLKSTRFNEYLYASDVKFEKDNNYSYVFSWKAGSVEGLDSAFAWKIQGC